MATKGKSASPSGDATRERLAKLHKAYVSVERTELESVVGVDPDKRLRRLAREVGVPWAAAYRAKVKDCDLWEVERKANEAEAWRRQFWPDLTEDRESFLRAGSTDDTLEHGWGHLCRSPEGIRLARALAARIWWLWASRSLRWKAEQEVESARIAFDKSKCRRKRASA